MRVPLGWLSEWVELPASVEELAERFTMSGLEVDAIERTGPDLSGIVVGAVQGCEPHPGADRLSVCRVDTGGDEPAEIVCGAPNVAAGQKVAVAIPGSVLPDGTKIKKTKIRGVVSLGMICSERELGLSEAQEGILVLADEAPVGETLDAVVRSGETVLDIAILANRGDCTSMLGMAREVKAYYGNEICLPETGPQEGSRETSDDVAVGIEAPLGCPLYEARIVRGIQVGETPGWLVERLEAAGLRPVNLAVDISNWVMLEWGQPLHFFDLDKLREGRICVREALAGETLVTLDGVERKLEAGDVIIADGQRPIAIAGIMGGHDTEVSPQTRNILIEAALFDPSRVRKTTRRLGIQSDAAYRFERGVDREGVGRALDRAARLLQEWTGGEVSRGVVRATGHAQERAGHIRLEPDKVNRLLGSDLSTDTMRELLELLGISVEDATDGALRCAIPSHRNDLTCPEDLIEEIVRLHGFEEIPVQEPKAHSGRVTRPALHQLADRVRDALCAEGLLEVLCFPFGDPEDQDRLGLDAQDPRRDQVVIQNPMIDRDSKLRSSLLPSLLSLARDNFSRQVEALAVFEVARVFRRDAGGGLPVENLRATALLTRHPDPGLWERSDVPLFFAMKGMVERIASQLGRGKVEFSSGDGEPYLHPGATACLALGGKSVGSIGELHPGVAEVFGLGGRQAVVLDLDLGSVVEQPFVSLLYREVSRHPRVRRDLAVVLAKGQPAGEVVEAIRKEGGASLVDVEVFDRYEGEGLAAGRVSVAFRLVFQRVDRTLKDSEVTKATDRIVQMLAHRFDGELR